MLLREEDDVDGAVDDDTVQVEDASNGREQTHN